MIKKIAFILFLLTVKMTYGQSLIVYDCVKQIDLLLNNHITKPFNGVILISQNEKNDYFKADGYKSKRK